MRGIPLFLLIVTIPALAALGHDIFLFYDHYGFDSIWQDLNRVIDEKGFSSLFASLGFIWTQYEPESYKWVVENTDEDTWARINTFLTYKAVVVGVVYAGIFYVLLGILKLLGVWPFGEQKSPARFSGSKQVDGILGRKPSGRIKYKRK